jgi:hypothetical protein
LIPGGVIPVEVDHLIAEFAQIGVAAQLAYRAPAGIGRELGVLDRAVDLGDGAELTPTLPWSDIPLTGASPEDSDLAQRQHRRRDRHFTDFGTAKRPKLGSPVAEIEDEMLP